MLVVEPRAVAELDEHLVRAEVLPGPFEIVERRILVHDVRRQLEEDAAQLAGGAERFERGEEAAKDLGAELARRAVHTTALVAWHLVTEVFRQYLRLHGMARHQAEGLDVHCEAVRDSLGPTLHHRIARQPVEGRVDFDRVEVLGVPGETFLRRQLRRIEPLGERLVGP